MSWFIQDQFGFTVAGPFASKEKASHWVIDNYKTKTHGLLIAYEQEVILEPLVVADKLTPALQKLQALGEVILVSLPLGFIAVYLCP